MASIIVTANTTAQQVAAERKNAAHYPKSMTVDNDGGGADKTIRIQDVFTPSVSNGEAEPIATTVDRLRVDVLQGDMVTFSEQDLKGIKCLGALKVIADAVDGGCYITVGYHTK